MLTLQIETAGHQETTALETPTNYRNYILFFDFCSTFFTYSCFLCALQQIIHLKRFNFVNNKWVKSQKVVNFPFDNFDPTQFLASVPQETILRHKELLELKAKNIKNFDCNEEITEFDLENDMTAAERNNSIRNEIRKVDQQPQPHSTKEMNKDSINLTRRKRLVSTSLTKTPVVDSDLVDYNDHKLTSSSDPFDLKYKLYAVVVSYLIFFKKHHHGEL